MSRPEAIPMVEFRRRAEEIIRSVQRGRRVILTYRGKPVVRLEPIEDRASIGEDDPFYGLVSHATSEDSELTNEEMDAAIYGE